MALIRGHHSFDDHFTQIPNDWVRDDRLTLEARGLLAQIMSHRPGWNLSIKSIASRNKIGRDKVKRILDELLALGYLERSEKQSHDENGHLAGYDYTTRDPNRVTQEPCKDEPDKAEPEKVVGPPKNTIPKKTIDEEKNVNRKAKPKNADEYEPSEHLLAELGDLYPGVNLESELEKFRDHHMANGSDFKLWDRAYRKWIRQASEWSREARAAKAKEMADADWERFKKENGLD